MVCTRVCNQSKKTVKPVLNLTFSSKFTSGTSHQSAPVGSFPLSAPPRRAMNQLLTFLSHLQPAADVGGRRLQLQTAGAIVRFSQCMNSLSQQDQMKFAQTHASSSSQHAEDASQSDSADGGVELFCKTESCRLVSPHPCVIMSSA